MYKVYINGLLNELTQHSCALSLNSISLTSPSFADDISLLSIYPTFFSTLMNRCYAFSIKWRYKFNHLKRSIVTFGESKHVCLDLVSPQMFWSISNQYPDLVTRLHVQIKLMGNFGFSACVPWTIRADESVCFVCKEAKDDLYHFLFDCSYFRKNFDSLW